MNPMDILAQAGGLQSMARELGVSENQAARGAQALLPAILGGFKKQAQAQPAGLEGLGGLLGQLGGGGLLDSVLSPQPTDVSRGNDVLGQIFGSRDVSRAVAQNAASSSGLAAASRFTIAPPAQKPTVPTLPVDSGCFFRNETAATSMAIASS